MKKTELKNVSEKFKSTRELPAWLLQGIPLNKQIRLIRQALGMTQQQLAGLIGTRQNVIARLEAREGNIELSTLRKIADALNCETLAVLTPRKRILEFLEEKATTEAKRLVALSAGSTAVEGELPGAETLRSEIQETKDEILKKYRSSLWQKKKREKKE